MRRNRWALVPLAALLLAGPVHGRDVGAPRYVVETFTRGTTADKIEIRDAAGAVVRTVGSGGGASWSPDGSQLAWVDTAGVHVEQADGAEPRLLVPAGSQDDCNDGCTGPSYAWSPDSRSLAVGGVGAGTRHLEVVSVADGSAHDIAPAGWPDFVLGWAPDGHVVYLRLVSGCCVGQIRAAETGRVHTRPVYTFEGRGVGGPDLSPDGRSVSLMVPTARGLALRIVDLRSGRRHDIPIPPSSVFGGTWSPDSRRIAVTRLGGHAFLVDVRTGRISPLAGRAFGLVWTRSNDLLWLRGPDGDHVGQVWTSSPAGRAHLVFRLPRGMAVTGLDVR